MVRSVSNSTQHNIPLSVDIYLYLFGHRKIPGCTSLIYISTLAFSEAECTLLDSKICVKFEGVVLDLS